MSYAHADNGVPLGARYAQGWVTALTSNLNVGPNVLAKRFFVDHQLRPGDDFGADLLSKVEHSSLLLLILSENYIESAWCGQELEHFTRTHVNDVDNPRDVFMVELAPYENFTNVPESIQLVRKRLLSVRFWYQLRGTSAPSLAGYPSPLDSGSVGRDHYWKVLNDLRGAMDRRLRELRASRS